MKGPITIIIPSLADEQLLAQALASLRPELEERSAGDVILVVDDSASGSLEDWLAREAPDVRVLSNPHNLGFARSVVAAMNAAEHGDVFVMNPDVRLREGCLGFLQETLHSDPAVFAVAPYVLLDGKTHTAESLPELVVEGGLPRMEKRALEIVPGQPHPSFPGGIPVAFALGGACLMRRADFLERPFDPRFEPFYWEDVDLCQSALGRGREVLVDPRAVAEHHHRGTIGAHVPANLVRAAIEKNRMLFAWKHLDDQALEENLHTLAARAIEHSLAEEREPLIWLLLALEQGATGESPSDVPSDR